jgi:hypothetical protein
MTQSSPNPLSSPQYYWLLWAIALTSLLMNVALAAVLLASRAQLQSGVVTLAAALDDVTLDDIALTISIDETVPVSLTIPYSDTFRVPIRETIPSPQIFCLKTLFRCRSMPSSPLTPTSLSR